MNFLFQQAEKSIQFYKCIHETENRKIIDYEINALKQSLDINVKVDNKTSSHCSDSTSRIGRKAMIIATILIDIYTLSGFLAISNYASNIFQDTGSCLSPNTATIIVNLINLIGTCIVIQLVDRLGRKVKFISLKMESPILCFLTL